MPNTAEAMIAFLRFAFIVVLPSWWVVDVFISPFLLLSLLSSPRLVRGVGRGWVEKGSMEKNFFRDERRGVASTKNARNGGCRCAQAISGRRRRRRNREIPAPWSPQYAKKTRSKRGRGSSCLRARTTGKPAARSTMPTSVGVRP